MGLIFLIRRLILQGMLFSSLSVWLLSLAVSVWWTAEIMTACWQKRSLAADVEVRPVWNMLLLPHERVQEKMCIFSDSSAVLGNCRNAYVHYLPNGTS